MPFLYIIGGLIALGLMAYLVLALLKPEMFS
jgi:K+-transporting ATPase KdpF subunit